MYKNLVISCILFSLLIFRTAAPVITKALFYDIYLPLFEVLMHCVFFFFSRYVTVLPLGVAVMW
jgi:hypothetical protein